MTTITKATSFPNQYPRKLNLRETKLLETAEKYTPSSATDWTDQDAVTTAPDNQDEALDALATGVKNLEANDPDTIISAQGDMIQGDASANGVKLTVGTANEVLLSDGTSAVWGDVDTANLATGAITDEKITDGEIQQDKLDTRSLVDNFAYPIRVSAANGYSDPANADTSVNTLDSFTGRYTYTLIGAADSAAVAALAWTEATKLDLVPDATDDEGLEVNSGITAASPYAFTVGTDNFSIEAQFKVTTVAGSDEIIVGFRKAEAHQADYDAYDEAAFLNIDAGTIKVGNIINNGSTVETTTTDVITDGQFARLKVHVDDVQGLVSAVALGNAAKTAYNAHYADVAEHTGTAVGTAIAADDATNLATLITLITEMLTDYDTNHDADAEAGTPTYHVATEAGDQSLDSAAAPTDLATCIAKLNHYKAKYNGHDADSTAHTTGGTHLITETDASRIFYTLGANTATLTAPTATDEFYLDDGEVVVPFIRFKHNATTTATCYLQYLKIAKD